MSVLCRSTTTMFVGGPIKVLSRGTSPASASLIRRFVSCLLRGKGVARRRLRAFRPSIYGHLSEGADKVITTKGALRTLRKLDRVFHSHALGGCCLYLMGKRMGRGREVRNCLIGGRGAGGIAMDRGGPTRRAGSKGRTSTVSARCGILTQGGRAALLRIRLVANGARRVHTRLTSVKRPVTKSCGCKGQSFGSTLGGRCKLHSRLLRTCHLRFPRGYRKSVGRLSKGVVGTPIPILFRQVYGTRKIV